MSRKSREEKRRKQAWASEPDAVSTVHATVEEANAALSETARVINMKERTTEMNKKKATAVAKDAKAAKVAKVRADGLPELPGLPKTKSIAKQKPLVPCQCGCGGTTRARFAPGHDSYFRGIIARVDRKIMTIDEVESIVGKGQREAVEAFLIERKKQERAAARGAKKNGGEVETATGTES